MGLFSPDGKPLTSAAKVIAECVFMMYLEPDGGKTNFELGVKIAGLEVKRIATYDDVLRMCYETISTIQAMKTNLGMEKVLDIKDKIKSGELKITDKGLEAGEPKERLQ